MVITSTPSAPALEAILKWEDQDDAGAVKLSREMLAEPKVGIFWVVDGRLVLYATPLSQAEPYGPRALNHPIGHDSAWEDVLKGGAAPPGTDYIDYPRGRVLYDRIEGRFSLLADRCILGDAAIMREILERLALPSDLKVGGDSHYRCPTCLYPAPDDEDDE